MAVPVPLHTAVYRLVKAREACVPDPSQGLTLSIHGVGPCEGDVNEGLSGWLRGGRVAVRGGAWRRWTGSRSGPTTSTRRTSRRSTSTVCGYPAPGSSSGASTRRPTQRSYQACDFGIVAVKSMFTDAAMADTAGAFAAGAVCSVQNGAGDEELVARARSGGDRRDDVPSGARRRAGARPLGHEGDTHLGPFEPRPAPFARGGARRRVHARRMPTHALEDARGAQWRKLIFNAASNAIGALTGLTHGRSPSRRRATSPGRSWPRGGPSSDAQGIVLDMCPGGAVPLCGPQGRRLRPQADHAPGRRGGPARPRSTS